MTTDVPTILDDTRKITGLMPRNDEYRGGYSVGAPLHLSCWCDEIRAYAENGQCAPVPFFAVYRDGQIIARIPAHMVEVHYA